MKQLIRNLFRRFGYDIIRKDDMFGSKKDKNKTVRVWNYYISMPGNNTLLRTYKIYPDFNSHLSRLAKKIAHKYPDMVIVDIGANVGDTIAVLRSVVDVPIIGIEGDDISYQYLKENTKQFQNISIIKTFLGEKRQNLKVEFESTGWNTTIIPTDTGEKTISFETLDHIIDDKKLNNPNIKLIKIDAEGFDTIVLRGSYNIISKHFPVLFFEYNLDIMKKIGEDGRSTIFSYSNYGYSRISFFDYLGRLLLSTSLDNIREINSLLDYLTNQNNLLGYYDVCIFHKQDDELPDEFLREE